MNVYYFSWYYLLPAKCQIFSLLPLDLLRLLTQACMYALAVARLLLTLLLLFLFVYHICWMIITMENEERGKLQSYMHSQTLILFTIYILLDPTFQTKWELALYTSY